MPGGGAGSQVERRPPGFPRQGNFLPKGEELFTRCQRSLPSFHRPAPRRDRKNSFRALSGKKKKEKEEPPFGERGNAFPGRRKKSVCFEIAREKRGNTTAQKRGSPRFSLNPFSREGGASNFGKEKRRRSAKKKSSKNERRGNLRSPERLSHCQRGRNPFTPGGKRQIEGGNLFLPWGNTLKGQVLRGGGFRYSREKPLRVFATGEGKGAFSSLREEKGWGGSLASGGNGFP